MSEYQLDRKTSRMLTSTHRPVILVLLLQIGAGSACCAEPKKSSAIVVEKTRLTFDPKTCTTGQGAFYWGLGSVRVSIVEQRDGQCVFDYQWEVEQPEGHQIYRVSVPLDSGPVVIDASQKSDEDHHWSTVYTSFTAKQATLRRVVNGAWCEDPLPGTDFFVAHSGSRPGDEDKPLTNGDKVTVRILLFLDDDFVNLVGEKWRRQSVTVTLGEDPDWKWLQLVLSDMRLYEIRKVKVPASVAGPARDWLPGYTDTSLIYAEVQAIQRENR